MEAIFITGADARPRKTGRQVTIFGHVTLIGHLVEMPKVGC
jgi:hypothetical protein